MPHQHPILFWLRLGPIICHPKQRAKIENDKPAKKVISMGGRKMIAILNTSLKGDDALIGIGNLTIRILLIQSKRPSSDHIPAPDWMSVLCWWTFAAESSARVDVVAASDQSVSFPLLISERLLYRVALARSSAVRRSLAQLHCPAPCRNICWCRACGAYRRVWLACPSSKWGVSTEHRCHPHRFVFGAWLQGCFFSLFWISLLHWRYLMFRILVPPMQNNFME